MPRIINDEVESISVEKGPLLVVAPELGGKIVVEKTQTTWYPPQGTRLYRLGVYSDGVRSSYYRFEGVISRWWLRFRFGDSSFRSSARVEMINLDEVPAELWLPFLQSWAPPVSHRTDLRRALTINREIIKTDIGIEAERLDADLPLLGGYQMLTKGSMRRTPWRARWVPPSGSVRRIKFRKSKNRFYVWEPDGGRKVLLSLIDGKLGLAREARTPTEVLILADKEEAEYLKS